ncbi:MAG: carboxypeptidase regulatory-like domain-containing protein, partial [Anaerolineae bacterium]
MRFRAAAPLLGTLLLALAAAGVLLSIASAAPAATVSGVVVNLDGKPVGGAVVRQKLTSNATSSASDGSFTLGSLPEGITVTVTAWQEGYLVGWVEVMPPRSGVTITLKAHYTTDDPDYQWFSSNDPEGPISCVHCMVAHPQWRENAHGTAGTNPRFFSLYNGTDITGTGTISPGYKLDFPGTAGNCATCHAPAAAVRGLRTFAAADMNDLPGVEAEGVFCEFCHKVGGVYLDPATGLPYNNAPGVLSMRLYRPSTGGAEQLFFGPFDDVTRRVSYLELEKRSQFCAPCHQFSFWGTPIYESFREWLESPYPAQGI